MSKFKQFNELMQAHVNIMFKQRALFRADTSKDELWDTYLGAFLPGDNELFRERNEHDCQCCKQYIRAFGNVVAIDDHGNITTIWEFDAKSDIYQPVINALNAYVRNKFILDKFVTKETSFGTLGNYGESPTGEVETWHHFHTDIPSNHQYQGSDTVDTVMSEHRANAQVLQRSLIEIPLDAVETVIELIEQGSLYKGEEWAKPLSIFHKTLVNYSNIPAGSTKKQNSFCWKKSTELGPAISRIRNHSIGVLLQNIAKGEELMVALTKYDSIVAPSNYKRKAGAFTNRMKEKAIARAEELGLTESWPRRFATIHDITINDVLHGDRSAVTRMKDSPFDKLTPTPTARPRDFTGIETVPLNDFVENVLPGVTKMEVMFSNKHVGNLVSLIAPQNPEAPSIMKWDNNFGWAYNGNMTDSMKERVKAAGGSVTGDLRFSIQWNEQGQNYDDLDAHCRTSRGHHVYFSQMRAGEIATVLDVDVRFPQGIAVENITSEDRNMLKDGIYRYYVHVYSHRSGRHGFRAQMEFDGVIHSYNYTGELRQDQKINVATVTVKDHKFISIEHHLQNGDQGRTEWGIETNQFHTVQACMYSPNWWCGEKGIGHRHVMFMLKDCINDQRPNGFFNEFLRPELSKDGQVFEALGSAMRVEPSAEQLSGLGFSTSKRDTVVVRVTGKTTRILNVSI